MAKSLFPDEAADLADLQAFVDLRDRVGKAVREIEKLQKENSALKAKVKELEGSGGGSRGFVLSGEESPEVLKAKIEGFIATIDGVLGETVVVA